MIVFDVSALVSAALKIDSIPERALLRAAETEIFALSVPVWKELEEVLTRPKLAMQVTEKRRRTITDRLLAQASWFDPTVRVTDCRDPGDDKYLELALVAGADFLVSGDGDLLVLNPWRGVRILKPAEYLVVSQLP